MKELNNKNKKLDTVELAFKTAMNCTIKGIDPNNISTILDTITELSDRILIFCSKANNDKEINIIKSYMNQGFQIIDDLEKKGEENESK